MKKFYSLMVAMAAVVASISTSADANAAVVNGTGSRMSELSAIKPLKSVVTKPNDAVKAAAKHKAKKEATAMSDILGSYYSTYYYYDEDYETWASYITPLKVEAGEGNEVVLNNFWDTDVTVKGVYDANTGTITLPKQLAYSSAYGFDVYLEKYELDDDGYVNFVDGDMTLEYDPADGTLFSMDYWGLTIYEAGETDLSEDNCYGFLDYCLMMVCVPTNGECSYSFGDYDYLDNVACSVSDNVLSVENFGGYGMIVKFDIDSANKTVTATNQYIGYEEDDSNNYYFYYIGQSASNIVVTGTITGDDNNIVLFDSFDLIIDGESYGTFSDFELVTPFNLITAGVGSVAVDDENAPVEYFNLQGVKVAEPASGLYIRRQGSNATKVVVK